jgi:hypothetical protein
MANELKAFPIANLIQGISQQTPQQRRETQAEVQYDCFNSPVNGCEARPHWDFIKQYANVDVEDAYCYELFRGDEEHYLVVVADVPYGGHRLHVYDLSTGDECTVTYTASENYLICTDNFPKDALRATTVNDYTFIANREVLVEMDETNLSPTKFNEGIIYFKAGGYKVTFQVSVVYNNHVYVFAYETPDNSVSGNAAYITTNQLAVTFYRGFTGGSPVPHSSGSVLTADNGNVGAVGTGLAAASGPITLISLGFYVGINGNCLIIGRSDNAPFTIDTADGVGDTYLKSVKETAQSFNDLPKSCFQGFTTKVIGTNTQQDDDYYVSWTGQDGGGGYWREVVKPETPLTFTPTTAPHVLVNTGLNTFEFKTAPWGDRISGDGETSAKDPSFVGRPIRDMFYDNSRLAILTEGTCVWSRSRNPFVYFPDSAQTTLDTDPIDVEIGGGKTIALLRTAVQQDEATFLWAPKIQFRVTSGNNPFKQDTVEAKPSTRFEYAPNVVPASLADSVIFATEPGNWATIRDLLIQDGKPRGASDITGHVRKLIPKGLRWLTASDTMGTILANSDANRELIYCYNFLMNGQERIQSAWNIWRLPPGRWVTGVLKKRRVVWMSLSQSFLYMLVQSGPDMQFVKMDLSVDRTDVEYPNDYLTRMDWRVTEAECTVSAYSTVDNTTTITLPYGPGIGAWVWDGTIEAQEQCIMFCANRSDTEVAVRGKVWPIKSIGPGGIVVEGDCSSEPLYIGFRITAERQDGTFYLKGPDGLIPTQHLNVERYSISYAGTGYFRAEVTYKGQAKVRTYIMPGRTMGDPLNVTDRYPITEGTFPVPISAPNDQFKCRLVNDSFLPSRWTTAQYNYTAAFLAAPQQGLGTNKS